MNHLVATEIAKAFRDCGIGYGDVVMLHSDALFLAQLAPMSPEDRYNTFFHALDEVLGADGTLILPTFTYSLTKGEIYSIVDTPSTVGVLSEHFRKLAGVMRSHDPIFSVAARGRYAKQFSDAKYSDCFGPQSAFGLLKTYNAWIVCLGCSLNKITFVHYVEQKAKVNYRYFKSFYGAIEDKGKRKFTEVKYYVRNLDRNSITDLSSLSKRLEEKKMLLTVPLGRVALSATRAHDFLEEANCLLLNHPSGLIAEGNN